MGQETYKQVNALKAKRFGRIALLAALLSSSAFVPLSWANPQGGEVVGGAATISEAGKSLSVHQQTDRVVIDWRSFNIEQDEITTFYQPSAQAIALNRVNSADPSYILGQLKANGNLILINPNGVFFGQNAVVDVNGLLATSADIQNDAFMAGSLTFDQAGSADAAIINEGTITAKEAGLVGLVAPYVENRGVIQAKMGRVQLASGDTLTADFYGDGLLSVEVSDDTLAAQFVGNTGTLEAEGGVVAMTAAAARQTLDSLIVVQGELKAPSISQRGGKIIIGAASTQSADADADTGSTVIVQASLDASGRTEGAQGGAIEILGDHITLKDGTTLDTAGDLGGGDIKIGGEYQGQGETQTAKTTTVENGALIQADAITAGDGGQVIVWSDEETQYFGAISTQGGSTSGDGGFVEISGKDHLVFNGQVDMRAVAGAAGTLLLDPKNIIVAAGGDAIYTDVSTYAASADLTETIDPATLEAIGGNVVLQATNDITVNDAITLTTAGASLTAQAGHAIFVNADIITNNGDLLFEGITKIAATLDAGSGNITVENTIDNGANGGIILSDGANLIGHDIWLHADPGVRGAEIRLLSGSQINVTGSVTLQDDSTRVNHDRWQGIVLYDGTTINAADLTLQTNGATIDYNGSVLNVTGDTLFRALSASTNRVYVTSALHANNIIFEADAAPNLSAGVAADNNLILRAYTASKSIGLAGAAGDVQYTSALLNNMSAATMIIGAANQSGALTLDTADWGSDLHLLTDSGLISMIGAQTLGDHDFTLETNMSPLLSSTITTTGMVTLRPQSDVTTMGIAGGAGSLSISSAFLDNITAGGLTIGRTDGSGLMSLAAYDWRAPLTLQNGDGDILIDGAQTMGANSFFARTYGLGDILIGAAGSVSSAATGNALTLVSGRNFINNAGAGALDASDANGRWLVYSADPASDTLGGLNRDFKRYNKTYAGYAPDSVTETGNGFLYAVAPTVTVSADDQTRFYGQVDPTLTYSYVSGLIDGDTLDIALSGALVSDALADSPVGDYAITGGTLMSPLGYALVVTPGVLSVNPKPVVRSAAVQLPSSWEKVAYTDDGLPSSQSVVTQTVGTLASGAREVAPSQIRFSILSDTPAEGGQADPALNGQEDSFATPSISFAGMQVAIEAALAQALGFTQEKLEKLFQ